MSGRGSLPSAAAECATPPWKNRVPSGHSSFIDAPRWQRFTFDRAADSRPAVTALGDRRDRTLVGWGKAVAADHRQGSLGEPCRTPIRARLDGILQPAG